MVNSTGRPIRPLASFLNEPSACYYTLCSPTVACQSDPRFSYCTYLPKAWTPETAHTYRLLVVVHGSDRVHQHTRDMFIDLAEEKNLVILAPLFPCGIDDPADTDGYKYIQFGDIRFDHLLLDMVRETEIRFSGNFEKFAIFGFSGGAHFAHRFFYIHPERLSALSVAAPGSVTLLDDTSSWWVGTGDFQEKFGKPLDLTVMRNIPAQLIVGAKDNAKDLVTNSRDRANWMEGSDTAGSTRVDRLKTLYKNWQESDLQVELCLVADTGHDLPPLVQQAHTFFSQTLA